MPKIAIYPRKSKFSEKSESIANQVFLCKEYCDKRFDNPEYFIYDEDEGFSGKNTQRPAFQRMMADLRAKKVDTLICYRLDRISRSVSDFSMLLDELQRHGVSFVSLRESFDTSTPIGRAMVYIASVFAQLERETLAERVKDNLHELAKTGRWLGGNTPYGYNAVTLEGSSGGKSRKSLSLAPVEDELARVRILYQRFVEYGSLTKLLTYCLQHKLTTRQGSEYSRMTLRMLLSNPVYAIADADAWSYFSANGHNLCANETDFDGIHGIQPFNRTGRQAGSTVLTKETSEWIIAVGKHPGAVPSKLWIEAQKILDENKNKGATYKAPRTEVALLSGVIRCASCGNYMRPKIYGQPQEDGGRLFSYICVRKIESKGARCAIKNAQGNLVDQIVLRELSALSSSPGAFPQPASIASLADTETRENAEKAIAAHEQTIQEAQRKIDNLLSALSEGVVESVKNRILQQVNELDGAVHDAQASIHSLNQDALNANADFSAIIASMLSSFDFTFSARTHDEKRRLIKSIVDAVTWDGENIKIDILGARTLPK